jgi:glyoxylase-like metal-dependent hydrolase (beta-lactamase superfamily II)
MNSGTEIRSVVHGSPGAASTFQQTRLKRLAFADVLARLGKSIKAANMWILHEIDPYCLVENLAQSRRRKSMQRHTFTPAGMTALFFVAAMLLADALPISCYALSPVIAINEEAKKANVQPQLVRGDVSVLEGSGGNITVLNRPAGKFLVDGGISYSKDTLVRALQTISSAPPLFVVNTHYHWDHTDGNAWLHDLGATIIAHPNTLKHLSTSTRVDDWEFTFPPAPSAGRPTDLVSKTKTMRFEGTTVRIAYYGPSHTDSDLSVYFVEPDVFATGDTWWNGYYPFIDNENGGSIDGMIRAAKENVERVTEKTLIVPGHGPIGGRAQLIEYRDMLINIRAKVAALKHQGKSRAEVVAAKPTAAYDAKWGGFVINPDFFTRLVFDGLPAAPK